MKLLVQKLLSPILTDPQPARHTRLTAVPPRITSIDRFWLDVVVFDDRHLDEGGQAAKAWLGEQARDWIRLQGSDGEQYRLLLVAGSKRVRCDTEVILKELRPGDQDPVPNDDVIDDYDDIDEEEPKR